MCPHANMFVFNIQRPYIFACTFYHTMLSVHPETTPSLTATFAMSFGSALTLLGVVFGRTRQNQRPTRQGCGCAERNVCAMLTPLERRISGLGLSVI
ncbi:hypothetical protein GYMLUDRAFT_552144 [Collybiopsis luxurians FD-317 M1]|uniref:Uncharacterized protein n=1 Tax=Collybiopsis luxurians FD-317 M1 TaxID=944289 RepID=A0A0D0CZT8_9AGAR|nr:hypothetical protein GYMLUDRAFT_552144 [Collybiopsis luxurians FD-317 M1]